MSAKPVILFVEPVLCAHSIGYLRAILKNEDLFKKYEVHFTFVDAGIADEDTLVPLEEEFGSRFKAKRIEVTGKAAQPGQLAHLLKSWVVLKAVSSMVEEIGAEKICFLYADFIVKLLGFPMVTGVFENLKGKVSGVFFNSRCFREQSPKSKILSSLINRGMKSELFRKILFLDHGVVEGVREKVAAEGNPEIAKAVDPWSDIPTFEEVKSGDRKTLLCFGAHSIRKGTLGILRMFRDFPRELSKYHLLVAGPVRDEIREEFYELERGIREGGGSIEVIDRYIEDQESWGLFHRSDIVLCPYVDFHGSSNVIIRSAALGLPVIGPDFGFIGELIQQEKVGSVFPPEGESAEILNAVVHITDRLEDDQGFYLESCRKYADFHSENQYAPSFL